jgi:hypothetical protein
MALRLDLNNRLVNQQREMVRAQVKGVPLVPSCDADCHPKESGVGTMMPASSPAPCRAQAIRALLVGEGRL